MNPDFQALADSYGVPTVPTDHAAPFPVPRDYFRALCRCVADPEVPHSKGQREAARLLKVSDRAVRYWCGEGDTRETPWSAAELLRRLIIDRDGGDHNLPNPDDYPPEAPRDEPAMSP
jgi:hypothetical protein